MKQIHPSITSDRSCPHCETVLDANGWTVPGMRMLVDLSCPNCGRAYYEDLPTGHGLHYPMVLDRKTGDVYHDDADWFATWLREDYAHRETGTAQFDIEGTASGEAVLLNCLDRVYGHALLKLLNAQRHLETDDGRDLVVLVPSQLRWVVPDGVDVVCTVEWSLDEPFWSDRLADEIQTRLADLEACYLSPAFPLPPSDAYDIRRFTGVEPFPQAAWEQKDPTVTVVWRSDRAWTATRRAARRTTRLAGYLIAGANKVGIDLERRAQTRRIVQFSRALREQVPSVDVAVAGIGSPGGLPNWLSDYRTASPDESAERRLCERYAESHVVVGVHGSNMILPSAHAGSVVDIVPRQKWGNVTEDLHIRNESSREGVFHCRNIPGETPPAHVASVVASLLTDRFSRGWHKEDSASAPTWADAYR